MGRWAGVLALVALTGCGTTSGFLRNTETLNDMQFRMEVGGVRYSRSVSGSSRIGSVLCVIPVGENAYQHAMEGLYAQAQLGPNEVLTNFREDSTFIYYLGFYCLKQLTISADVMQVTPAGAAQAAPLPTK